MKSFQRMAFFNAGGMSGLQPTVLLLREGTDTSQGKAQLISNINACQAVAEAVRTTLGPRGMDKLIHDGHKVSRRSCLNISAIFVLVHVAEHGVAVSSA